MIESGKKYKIWSDFYERNGNSVPITWDGRSADKLYNYFPTWKELQGEPVKTIRKLETGVHSDEIWLVLSLRYGFKFRINSTLLNLINSLKTQIKCICNSRKLFISGCDCGGI